jgi:transcriptional regulator with XRE-family HTH domain
MPIFGVEQLDKKDERGDLSIKQVISTYFYCQKKNAMKENDFLKDLQIGEIIKEIAIQKNISSKQIADIIRCYQKNADKIFHLNDMNVEDIVKISYLFEYNILDFVSQKYLSHLPYLDYINAPSRIMKFNLEKKEVLIYGTLNNSDFLKKTHIGQHIKEMAENNKWNVREMARRLQCSSSLVIYIYKSKSLTLKKLIYISNALQFNFIAKAYLSQMTIILSLKMIEGCTLSLDSLQLHHKNQNDTTIIKNFYLS